MRLNCMFHIYFYYIYLLVRNVCNYYKMVKFNFDQMKEHINIYVFGWLF